MRTPPRWALAAAVAVLSFLAFAPALGGDFVNWDDEVNFVHNPNYRGLGPAQLRWMFTEAYGHYMPFTWLTLGADYALYGMNPAGYHATSLLFHAANAAVFFLVVLLLLRRALPEAEEGTLRWASALGALLFALHPLRAESVAWVTERRDVVSGLFFMISAWGYLRWREDPAARKWFVVSVGAFLASLLSKAMGMMLPVVLLAVDVYPLRRLDLRKPSWPVLREKIPYFALLAAAVVVTKALQQDVGALRSASQYPAIDILLQPGYRLCFYVVKTLLPVGLSPLYPFESLATKFNPMYAVATVAVIAAAGLLWRGRRPAPATAAFAYAALISPVIVWQAGPHFAADRYTYLACLPFAALAAGAAAARGRSALLGAGLVSALLFGLAWRQAGVWKNSVTLWDQAISAGTDSPLPYVSRGAARAERGDSAGAFEDFRKALEADPKEKRALTNLSRLSYMKGAFADAESYAARAIDCDPKLASAWHNRAVARAERRDYAGAIEDFTRALELAPREKENPINPADLLSNRAVARQKAGDLAGAEADASQAAAVDPRSKRAVLVRAAIRVQRRDLDGALADFTQARELDPAQPAPLVARGMARAEARDYDGALLDYGDALRQNPQDFGAVLNRGALRAAQNDDAAAIADFSEAIRINPRVSVAWAKRGRSKGKRGDLEGAIADCSEALRLDGRNAEAFGVRGCARGDRGDLRGAVVDFEDALSRAPADWAERKFIQSMLEKARSMVK